MLKEREPILSSTLEASGMEQPCSLTEAYFVNDQVDVYHDVQSDLNFHQDTKYSATDLPGGTCRIAKKINSS